MKKHNLHNINKPGFKIPENYLQDFEDQILSEVKLKERIETSGFEVPQGYFDTLEQQIMSKVSKESTTKVIPLVSTKTLIYISSIAACFILMFSIFNNNTELNFDDLETASIENYLSEEDINSLDIAALLSDDELSTKNFIDSDFNDDLLENYLLQNTLIEDLILE